jgi:tetratricopeptide (TPR) repeat protein
VNPARTLACLVAVVGTAVSIAPAARASRPLANAAHQPADPPRDQATAPPLTPAVGMEALRASARAEASRPATPIDIEPPAGIDPARFTHVDPASPEGELARKDYTDVLVELASERPRTLDAPAERPPPAVISRALLLYANGRSKIAAQDTTGAINDLQQAAKLDPSSPQIWTALGDAQLAAGQRLGASSSYASAVNLGTEDARVWWLVGHDLLRSNKPRPAAVHLARAIDFLEHATDPALEYIVYADLGEALIDLGYIRAGLQAVKEGTSIPTPLPWTTHLRNEVIDLVRKRAEIRRDAGDAAVRISDTLAALDFYELSAEDGQLDDGELIARRSHALWASGRPIATAALIVEEIAAQPLPVNETELSLLRRLARDPSAGPFLASAVSEAATESRVPGQTATRQWIRAQAASLSPQESRVLLRESLAQFPEADDLFRDLLDSYPRNDVIARVDELVKVVERSPRALTLTSRLLATSIDIEGELAILDRHRSPAAAIVRTQVLLAMGRVNDATSVKTDSVPASLAPYAAAIRLQAFAAAGQYDKAETELAIIREQTPADDPLLLARSYAELQRFTAAFNALPLPHTEQAENLTPQLRLAAAGLALRASRPEPAEAAALSILRSDPFNDEAYEILAALYGAGSPLADEEKLGQTFRLLRQATPNGRTVRWLTAQEMIGRRMDGPAFQLLSDMALRGWVSEPIVAAFAGTLERQSALGGRAQEEALASARRFVARYPEIPSFWIAHARALAAAGQGQEAHDLLLRRYGERPWPVLEAAREAIIRDILGRPEDAKKLAMDRLAVTPRPIDLTVSYAVEVGRAQGLGPAITILKSDLPAEAELTSDQQTRIATMMAASFRAGDTPGSPPMLRSPMDAQPIAELMGLLVSRGAKLTPQMHQARIKLLCTSPTVDVAELRRACEDAGRDVPAIATAAYLLAAQELVNNAKRPQDAVQFMVEALRRDNDPGPEILASYTSLVAQSGTSENINELESFMGSPERLGKVLGRLDPNGKIPTDPIELRAEYYYSVSNRAEIFGRRDLAEAALRKALSIKPDHALANNDLGYFLLEAGRDPQDADRMLTIAHEKLPDSASVTDSLAWLRYHEGIIEDQANPHVEGALSLLERAATLDGGIDNATILDHLGDARWRAEKRDEAHEAWTRAHTILERRLRDEKASFPIGQPLPPTAQRVFGEWETELAAIKAKIDAVTSQQDPPVAPIRWPKGK